MLFSKMPRYLQFIVSTLAIMLAIMLLFRIAFIVVYEPVNTHWYELFDAMLLGFRYDARMACIIGLLLFLLANIKPLHPLDAKLGAKIIHVVLWLVSITMVLFYVIDFANYAYLGQRVTASLLNYADDAAISAGMVWQTYPVVSILIGIVVLVLLIRWWFVKNYDRCLAIPKTATKTQRVLSSIVAFLLMGWAVFGSANQYPLRWSDAFAFGNDYKASVALNPFQSFFATLKYRKEGFDAQKVKQLMPYMAYWLGLDSNQVQQSGSIYRKEMAIDSLAASKPNVVIVICESFSAYKSSAFGNALQTTPFFDSLSNHGILFTKCFTPAYGTARGVWATLTGVPDVQLNKTASRNPAAVSQHTIINDFKGYQKYYFLGGSTSWANIRGVLTNNIDSLHLYEEGDYKSKRIDVWGISDKNLFLEANGVLAKEQQPFVAIIQTADNHRPYTIPDEDKPFIRFRNVSNDSLQRWGFESMEELNAFLYTDYCYRKFIEAAQHERYFKNTIFMFIGDHGIKGNANATMPASFTTQGLTNMHVPWLVYAPGRIAPQKFDKLVSQVDVLPTAASLAGVAYSNTTLGRNVLAANYSHPAAFYFDVETKRIGVQYDSLLYTKNIASKGNKQVIITNAKSNAPVQVSTAQTEHLNQLTDAYYELARYLILNNKKR